MQARSLSRHRQRPAGVAVPRRRDLSRNASNLNQGTSVDRLSASRERHWRPPNRRTSLPGRKRDAESAQEVVARNFAASLGQRFQKLN
ncbi:hypothetical protein HPB50_002932 [Hyalomma asiaticum]|uniref:Uncharacterized protein n=1 Tax=Hyalomma asiaticum TaxID=266040 RepID=A0ACB7SLQ5_HYAAI|nr:hypothetical protein HPB50_002932 [Hyalomma asiaticum]